MSNGATGALDMNLELPKEPVPNPAFGLRDKGLEKAATAGS